MKNLIIGIGFTIMMISILSCSEPERSTQVWGKFDCNQCGSSLEAAGTLAREGGDYYGWCERTDTGLNIAVGQRNPNDANYTSELYFEARGIAGPPTEGVYEADGTIKEDPTTFTLLRVKYANEWDVTPDDIKDSNLCYVRLFAEAGEGEITPAHFDEEPFEVYVDIDCQYIKVDSTGGSTLTGVSMRAFFDECN